ncbi:MAG TPA: ubiquinol-cytochrome c reductase iron-sulfur subunit [Gaiellaceae bacterium]
MKWLWSALALLLGRGRRPAAPAAVERPRIVPRQPPSPRGENWVLLLLVLATVAAGAFIAVYAIDRLPAQTQLLGLALGLAFAFLAAAAAVASRFVVPVEEVSEPYPEPEHPAERDEVLQIVEESGERMTRRRLLKVAAGGAGMTLGTALVAPVASLGPALHPDALRRTPWRRGVRLMNSSGRPLRLQDIEEKAFYTAFPEHASHDELGAPLVVVRVDASRLDLPDGRDPERWAPDGVVAYSKICTHAGCAVALYRAPLFEPTSASPALVCPCHYSTFDPATGGGVLFGPAGRPLPQLPLEVDGGDLRAGGGFSGPIGPSWWGVRRR